MILTQKSLTLKTGQVVGYDYDPEGDLLEIIFQPGEATCAIELTESIIVRFDWATYKPFSLSFISFSKLIRPTKFGQIYFQLLNNEWPLEMENHILNMLQLPPLNEFLTLSSYAPADFQEIIPTTGIKMPSLELII